MTDYENVWTAYTCDDFDFANFSPNSLVADVGCGDGLQLKEVVQRGCMGFGIEPYWPSLSSCRTQGLRVLQGYAEQLPLQAACLDGLICKGVICLTDEPSALQELSRVLKAGGRAHFAYLGAGYYLRYLLVSRSWKHRFYGLRTLVNTWMYSAFGCRLPVFLGDTLYQSRRRLAKYYRKSGFRLVREAPANTFMGFPVFIYQTLEKTVQ